MVVERIELPAKSRRIRTQKPRYIILHTTQGITTIDKQYSATVNWFRNGGAQGEQGTWGPSCDIVIGHDGREAWFTLNGEDYHTTRANYSAGYGASSATTYAADEFGIAIELAQTSNGETPTQATLDAAVKRCAELCKEFGISPTRIEYLSQSRTEAIPSGIVGHEDTENGRRLGKWDPNKKTFPWGWFIAKVQAELAGPIPAPVTAEQIRLEPVGDVSIEYTNDINIRKISQDVRIVIDE